MKQSKDSMKETEIQAITNHVKAQINNTKQQLVTITSGTHNIEEKMKIFDLTSIQSN